MGADIAPYQVTYREPSRICSPFAACGHYTSDPPSRDAIGCRALGKPAEEKTKINDMTRTRSDNNAAVGRVSPRILGLRPSGRLAVSLSVVVVVVVVGSSRARRNPVPIPPPTKYETKRNKKKQWVARRLTPPSSALHRSPPPPSRSLSNPLPAHPTPKLTPQEPINNARKYSFAKSHKDPFSPTPLSLSHLFLSRFSRLFLGFCLQLGFFFKRDGYIY